MPLAARSAFARGDYMAVIDMAKPDMPAAIKLLLAQSYARIGADGLAAKAASDAITAILTASVWSNPAEREKESKVQADALGQLAASIDLFDVDRPNDARVLVPAVKEIHERLAAAEGHGKIVPLVVSSNPPHTGRSPR